MHAANINRVARHFRAATGAPTDRQLLHGFGVRGEQAAFAELVGRHGPMVYRVCRRVLRHEQDAEDAFQATFLVLAKKAASIRRSEALASWLYGVAHRVALRARRDTGRRRLGLVDGASVEKLVLRPGEVRDLGNIRTRPTADAE
jgi:RNA polymerase sigma factor (sigma-70 family)